MTSSPVLNDVPAWITENEKFFEPPICNKLMHQDGQLKVFFVGGPNKRKDFHVEEGEEFFYMLKGDMCLRVLEQGRFKDIIIKEGEVFLLPSRIPHSPQRQANTLGLVIERERLPQELDCLRYFVDDSTVTLWERWFHCDDLGSQLVPLIKEFFASEEYRTGKPKPGAVTDNPPYAVDDRRKLSEPFSLDRWIKSHRSQIDESGCLEVFDRKAESVTTQVLMFGKGLHALHLENSESFLWQWEGSGKVEVGSESYDLGEKKSLLVPTGKRWILENPSGALTLVVVMHQAVRDNMEERKPSPER